MKYITRIHHDVILEMIERHLNQITTYWDTPRQNRSSLAAIMGSSETLSELSREHILRLEKEMAEMEKEIKDMQMQIREMAPPF